MAFQPLDLVVALTAAREQRERGAWRPADVQRDLALPWSTLDRSLARLRIASVLRGDHISLVAIASLLPVLRYLFPLEVDLARTERGIPTGYASPGLEGRIRYEVPQVWTDPEGAVVGHPVEPLHPNLPDAARRDPGLGIVFSLVDAVRGGRAREVSIASERLRELLALPTPYASA